MIALIILASILAYVIIASWTFGYCGGLDGAGEKCHDPDYHGLKWYHNEECAWVPAIFWPGALVYFLIMKPIAYIGYRRGVKTLQMRKVRVELQEKFRIELEKAERELEESLDSQRVTPANERAA